MAGKLVDQRPGVGPLPVLTVVQLGQDYVQASLRDPPQVGQARLDLGGGVTMGPHLFEGPGLETFEKAGIGYFLELRH